MSFDASVPPDVIRQDIDSVAEAGGGGLEFVPYYLYGLPAGGTPPTDWTIFGFGSPAYKNLLKTALQETKAKDLVLDIAQGASQGQGVPSVPRTPGLAIELVYGRTEISSGQTFDGSLPQPQEGAFLPGFMHVPERFGDSVLKVVLAGYIKDSMLMTIITNESALTTMLTDGGSVLAPSTTIVLDEESIVDLSAEIMNSSLQWTAPAGNGTWTIIAFYENYTNQRSCSGGIGATDVIANGSWIVDHFSSTGARRITDFWDENLVDTEEIRDLIASAGEYCGCALGEFGIATWLTGEDSMEIQATLYWTPDFLQNFEARRGYSAAKYLPLFFNVTNQWGSALPAYNDTWVYRGLNSTSQSAVLDDYRTTLTEGYQNYLEHFVNWSHPLSVRYSAQPAYNLPLDMSAAVPVLDTPEAESLGFPTVDAARQFSGAALLTGKYTISTEVGAVSTATYTQTVPELLNLFKKSFAGGVSMMYPLTTWPGYNAFLFTFTEMWNNKVPSWTQIKDAFDYTARNSLVLETGRPQTDIAFYYYAAPWQLSTRFQTTILSDLGFSYDYLGPENLIQNATAKSNILAPSGPSYRALVFSNETTVPGSVINAIESYAAAGLPIFFIGQLPSDCLGLGVCTAGEPRPLIERIVSLYDNVQVIPDASCLATALRNASVTPRVSFNTAPTSWYSVWRKSDHNGEDYIYLYNEGNTTTTQVGFEVKSGRIPYFLDAWTGEKSPVLQYTQSESRITIPVTLRANQSRIYMFSSRNSSSAPAVHVVSSTGGVNSLHMYGNGSVEARAIGPVTLSLSDGRMITSNSSAIPAANIALWDLSVNSYFPSSPNSTATSFKKINYAQQLLKPWSQIAGLEDVSGVGEYNSTFNFSHDPEQVGASISFGPIKDTLRAWVNGQMIPPVDVTEQTADITHFVRQGSNTVRIVVTSTLFNAVKVRANSTMMVGTSAAASNSLYQTAPWADFGMVGPVKVQPLQRVQLV
ncbi:secreted protein [Rutstroemia sp. NJR-2017a BVV2]|nr:secreted protein [Rutstroemia sp. NJR-2017a BVV2]PQE23274.1 secreted protein [Rutstroemia sp. NJR-2017a BVV2]